jgi:two-component system KDP operon response regulator KdpE
MHLTPREFDLLRYLIIHANRVLSHRELLQGVWGPDYGNEVDTLRVLVNQLRKKVETQPSRPVFLLAEPWVGYRFSLSPHAAPAGLKRADDATIQRR